MSMGISKITFLQKLWDNFFNSKLFQKLSQILTIFGDVFMVKELMQTYLERKCQREHCQQLSFRNCEIILNFHFISKK